MCVAPRNVLVRLPSRPSTRVIDGPSVHYVKIGVSKPSAMARTNVVVHSDLEAVGVVYQRVIVEVIQSRILQVGLIVVRLEKTLCL